MLLESYTRYTINWDNILMLILIIVLAIVTFRIIKSNKKQQDLYNYSLSQYQKNLEQQNQLLREQNELIRNQKD